MDSTGFIEQAHQAIRAGQKVQARHLLQQSIRQNPQDYRAWLWLASVTASPQASLEYVKRAEMLKPESPHVKKARAWAEMRVEESEERGAKGEGRGERREEGGARGEGGDLRGVLISPLSSSESSWQSWAVRAGVVLLVIIFLAAGGLFAWDNWFDGTPATLAVAGQQGNFAAVAAVATAEPVLPTATPSATAHLIQPKNIVAASDDPRPTWTLTPTPTRTPTPTNTPPPTFISTSGGNRVTARPLGVAADERWIDVDLNRQILVAYEGNEPIFDTTISSGTSSHPTVTGQFRIWIKYESQTMDGRLLGYDYYLEDVPYVMYFFEDYALHGTYWHNNFGAPMSHGCVNMRTADAQWVFSWAGVGTVVNVHY
jgi:lipoprotein-anchoring transpeptidase ErfK/SrfK